MNACATYLPSIVNTWTRLLARSATYTKPSFETLRECTVLNWSGPGPVSGGRWLGPALLLPAGAAGASGSRSPGLGLGVRAFFNWFGESVGTLPNAPHIRLNAPVFASKTMTRR